MTQYNPGELGRKASQHLLDIFVIPEIKRRQQAGKLPVPLDLHAAQILFYSDKRKAEIRINTEVKAVATMKLKEGIVKDVGEAVYAHELEGLEDLMLTEDDDPDCGHATILRINNVWMLAFDFVYNKSLAKKHIRAAQQFIDAAEFSLHCKHWSAFADNLFSAAELSAKAVLLSFWSDPNFGVNASHKAIHQRYNRFAHLGNIDTSHAQTFNKLADLRYPARYLKRDFTLTDDEAGLLLQTVKQMLAESKRLTGL